MSNAIETFEVNGLRVEIHQDETEDNNPRETAENFGIFLAENHQRYHLGDKGIKLYGTADEEYAQAKRAWDHYFIDGHGGYAPFARYLRVFLGTTVILPVWLYDHSGLSVSTSRSPFDAQGWDSGIVGFLFDTAKQRERLGVTVENVDEALRSELSEYNSYLTGEVYGYTVSKKVRWIKEGTEETREEWEVIDSCWGFVGDIKYVREEATSAAEIEQPE